MRGAQVPSSGRAARKAARSAELLEAALRAIRADGAGTSIERIAAEAGITRPVIYRHFGDAGGLYQAVATRFADDLLARSAEATAGVRAGRTLVAAQVDGYLRFLEVEPNLYRFLTRQVPMEQSGGSNVVTGFIQQLGGMIAAFLEESGLPAARAAVVGRSFVGAVHVTSEWWLEDRELTRAELVEELTTMVWDGMGSAVAAGTVAVTR